MKLLIKLGGALLDDPDTCRRLSQEIVQAHRLGHHIVVVHGGGKQMTRFLAERGVEPIYQWVTGDFPRRDRRRGEGLCGQRQRPVGHGISGCGKSAGGIKWNFGGTGRRGTAKSRAGVGGKTRSLRRENPDWTLLPGNPIFPWWLVSQGTQMGVFLM